MSKNSANGSTRRWLKIRAEKLARDPWCEWRVAVAAPKCGEAAVEVDHIIPLKEGGPRFDMGNLRSICADHHKIRHGRKPHPPRAQVDPKTGLPTANHWWIE